MAQHLSIRVPWKDNGYNGFVCDRPCYNNACLRLKNIAENRDDAFEESLSGSLIKGHEAEIPCLSEGGCFMCSDSHTKISVHPYKESNKKTHGHFLETKLIYPPYSLPARPFRWTMLSRDRQDNIGELVRKYAIDYDVRREPILKFDTNWVQDAVNQRAIFKAFYEDVKVNESLVIPYAKQVPFIDDSGRVVMGIGRVASIVEPPEHNHTEDGELRSIFWETMIGHTIRDERNDGFLMPYREMMEYASTHPEFDIRSIAVLVEDEYFDEFSYATEHLSYDAVISVLLQTIKALKIIKDCISGNWEECIIWCEERLREVWTDRGAFPGLGTMLMVAGFECGELMAREIKACVIEQSGYEVVAEKMIKSPQKYFSDKIVSTIGQTEVEAFKALKPERKQLFWLLARMSLTLEQAETVYFPENRVKIGFAGSDYEIIANPYILYERTRRAYPENIISVKKIDMAVYPPEEIRLSNPLKAPTALLAQNDKRRIRAYLIALLEHFALVGHTVYPINYLIGEVNNLAIEPACDVTSDILNGFSDFLDEELKTIECVSGEKAYQLKRLYDIDEVIRTSVNKRLKGKRHVINEDWRKIVDDAFENRPQSEFEDKARIEKAAILKELAESRLSVLIGGAGTGKTTLLALLCKSEQIRNGKVLLLAPTGKARVRMSQAMQEHGVESTAKTVAQFLSESKRFDGSTMEYHLSKVDAKDVPFTVIIDESSMLTEEMFGALLEALRKNANRIIFVGDPNQLPPIGSGRPFVDLVNYLNKGVKEFPRVGKGFGQLTVTMRQISTDGKPRGDTELSKWYTSEGENLDDSIFLDLQRGQLGEYIAFKNWTTPEELKEKIFETLVEETCMESIDDLQGFNISLGGEINSASTKKWMNFGNHPEMVEDWQILSAYRNNASVGTATINRYIHERYRSDEAIDLEDFSMRSTKKMLGTEGILFGDKVINIRNHKRSRYNLQSRVVEDGYVANGEVGIVSGINTNPALHRVVFSSQPNCNYSWYSTVAEEGLADLELAYALTVHKSQGSEFKKAILVLAEPGGLLSKELLYTAITRQKDKLVILYNGAAHKLRDYASACYSEVARRFTCLFNAPNIVEYSKKFYEQSLIHTTLKGDLVRSKSEVIIANMLYSKGIEYEYEKELDLGEDGIRIPDFTINDAESGLCYYWEHCGMIGDAAYDRNWEKKKKIYAKHGIVKGDNLIVTTDLPNGGIDSKKIEELIDRYLC